MEECMKYLLYSESKILVLVKYFSDISWLPRKPPTSTRGALVARATECDTQHSMVLLEKSAASRRGCVLSIRPSRWSSGHRPAPGGRASRALRTLPGPTRRRGKPGSGVGRDLGHGGSGACARGWRQVSRVGPRGALPGLCGEGAPLSSALVRGAWRAAAGGAPTSARSRRRLQLRGTLCHPAQPGRGVLSLGAGSFSPSSLPAFLSPQVHGIELFTLLGSAVLGALWPMFCLSSFVPSSQTPFTPLPRRALSTLKECLYRPLHIGLHICYLAK